jgi:tetratricopeptide (TPR) repeat protein
MQTALSAERPFPGLRPYAFADSGFYFGREDQIYALYRLLDRSQFIAVVGSSGSGKSSLVRAGLLPLLEAETANAGARSWRWVEMRPGDAPLERLSEALASLLPEAEDEVGQAINAARRERIGFALRQSSFGLAEALEKIEGLERGSLVLVVDQFEELFRYATSAASQGHDPQEEARQREDAAHFVQLLLEAGRSRGRPVHVLTTMRSDFIGDCARFHGLPEAVSATQFLVPSLTRDQREEVIRRPIEKAGATIDPALVERLLNDGGDDLDQLPVIQHCLMRLWDRAGGDGRATRHLTLDHYGSVGSIAGALSQHAEEILDGLPGLELAIEQAFRALAEIDREGRAIRRAVPFAQLPAETGVPENELRQVVDRLRADDCSFLVPSPSSVAELAPRTRIDVGHEALLRRWERLSGDPPPGASAAETRRTGWLRAEDTDGRLYRGLLAFVDSEEEERTTLPLEQVEARAKWWASRPRTAAWAERYGGGFARVERLFKNSLAALKAQREAMAREARARRRRRHAGFAVAAGIVAVVVLFAGFSYRQWGNAEKAKLEAIAAQEATTAEKQRAQRALTLATEAANETVKHAAQDLRERAALPVSAVFKVVNGARELQDKLEGLGVATPELKHGRALVMNQMALAFANQSNSKDALAAAGEARDILTGLLAAHPGNLEWQADLAESHHRMGYAHHVVDENEQAVEAYGKALAIRKQLAEADPRAPARESLVIESFSAIGDAWFDRGDHRRALEYYRQGLAVGERLLAQFPDDPQWQARVFSSFGEIGSALPRSQRKERLDALQRSVEFGEKATAAVPGNMLWQKNMAYTYAYYSSALAEDDQYDEALDAAMRAMRIVEELMRRDPDNVAWQKVFSFSFARARQVFVAAGREDKVQDLDEREAALERRKQAAEERKLVDPDADKKH